MGFKIVVDQGNLMFNASHFITFMGKCERLHGHNYGVSFSLEGSLTPDGYVFDFVALKQIARQICESLDHRFLLPMCNPHLEIEQNEEQWEIRYQTRQYTLPARDVLPLPLDNITAERLAEYIWEQTVQELRKQDSRYLASLTVGVEEAPGQRAYFSRELPGDQT